MAILSQISKSVQQAAEAIYLALGVEVEIIDEEFNILAKTSTSKRLVQSKKELGEFDMDFLFEKVIKSGLTESLEDALCTPIICDGEVIGVIGLTAFNQEQRNILLHKKENILKFVEKMANCLSLEAVQSNMYNQLKVTNDRMQIILETVHEGMIAVNKKGIITSCNLIAGKLLKTDKEEMMNKQIDEFMPNCKAMDVLKTEIGYIENEEIYQNAKGKFHYIVTAKPFLRAGKIMGVVISFRNIEEAQKLVYSMRQGTLKYTFDDIIGQSENITKVKNQALFIAGGRSTVLITGESGTGKGMFAKSIHYASQRGKNAFVTVNCGAIPENLLESELFGYERGAFTGASEKGKIGKFELADGGTVFLDEIGDMPLHLQVKLLHILQNKDFERVGGNKTISVDVRIIAATNKNLEEMIRDGRFREDLYYRLSVIPLVIPPMRERKEDIILLMNFFLKKYSAFMNKNITGFTEEAKEIYKKYSWPGNVRELENAIEFGVNMTFSDKIGIDAIPLRIIRKNEDDTSDIDFNQPLNEQVRIFEKEILMKKLKEYGDSQKAKMKIADNLGISRATLYRKLAELGIG